MNSSPPPAQTRIPRDSATIPTGKTLFRWTATLTSFAHFLQIGRDPTFRDRPIVELPVTGRASPVSISAHLAGADWLYWRVISSNEFGITPSPAPYARFRVDPALPVANEELPPGTSGSIITQADRLSFDGNEKKLFELGEWPEDDYSVSFRFRLRSLPSNRIAQLFSAWAAPMDDPLRITVQDGKLSARLESASAYSTPAVPVEAGKWYELVATKQGAKLSLTIDGKERGSSAVPLFIHTRAKDFALGGNPHFKGNEFADAEIENLVFSTK